MSFKQIQENTEKSLAKNLFESEGEIETPTPIIDFATVMSSDDEDKGYITVFLHNEGT